MELLRLLRQDRNAFPEHQNKEDFIRLLLQNIGVSDSEIRDGLVYPVLASMIYYDDLSKDLLDEIVETLLSDRNLFFDLDNKIPDSVLTRSFSILQLVIVLIRHRENNFLSGSQVRNIYQTFMGYFTRETDYRGYVEEIGWAHSVAHSADLFQQLFLCEELTETEFLEMLEVIQQRFMEQKSVFICDEGERMVSALMDGFSRHVLSNKIIIEWIHKFADYEKPDSFPEKYYIRANIESLLRSLYFRLEDVPEMEDIALAIKAVLKEISPYKK